MSIPAATAPVDLLVYGAAFMRDRMMGAVDLEEFEAMDETDLDDHKERVERFCLSYCWFGRKAQDPGLHPRCERCPLRPLVVGVIAKQIEHAMKGDDDDQR